MRMYKICQKKFRQEKYKFRQKQSFVNEILWISIEIHLSERQNVLWRQYSHEICIFNNEICGMTASFH